MTDGFKKLADVPGVISVYSYEVPHALIPLVIVSKKIDRQVLKQAGKRSKGAILLTKKDIEDGQDAFALRFLHMQKCSVLLAGEDILATLDIKQKYARRDLEYLLRTILIDLREMMVKGDFQGGYALALNLDRISAYMQVINQKQKKYPILFTEAINHCKKKTMQFDDLRSIYVFLEKLTKHIDAL